MGFQEIASLDCDEAIQLGGVNKKNGKANPTKLEGYFIGSKNVESPKSKTGFSKLHIFQTAKGNLGVWGKTDLDRKLLSAVPGTMTRVTFIGMKETKNNPMYTFKVEVDINNSITVASSESTQDATDNDTSEEYANYANEDDGELDVTEEEAALDAAPPVRAVAPRKAAATPNAAQQARVQALLNGRGKSKSV